MAGRARDGKVKPEDVDCSTFSTSNLGMYDVEDFIAIVNRLAGRDLRWFFDGYLRSAALPELLATRDGEGLVLRWKTAGDQPFPLPVQVRVGDRIVDVAMESWPGRVAGGRELHAGSAFARAARPAAHRRVPARHR